MREELDFNGVILSDDLEMKAIADAYTVPDAAVQAIAAGCDGVLVCRANVSDRTGDAEAQVAVLEALVHAVEDGRIPFKRAEDALARNRRAKERFLAAPVGTGPSCSAAPVSRHTTSIAALPTRCRGTFSPEP